MPLSRAPPLESILASNLKATALNAPTLPLAMDNTEDDARRILIRANVKTIPGLPNARPWTLWEVFCRTHLNRAARFDAGSPSESVDVVHVLPGFDSPHDTKAWFLNDVGVKKERSSVDTLGLPHDVFLAHFDQQNGQWYLLRLICILGGKLTRFEGLSYNAQFQMAIGSTVGVGLGVIIKRGGVSRKCRALWG